MATFKYKPDKIKYLNNIDTLDGTHRKIVSDFERKRCELPARKTTSTWNGYENRRLKWTVRIVRSVGVKIKRVDEMERVFLPALKLLTITYPLRIK